MAGGRPKLWDSPEILEKLVDEYFDSTNRPTLSGLAVFLNCDRHTIYNYKERDEFFHIIKKATSLVESIYEERAIYENNPTGVIFALKNMGWSDKVENKTDMKVSGIKPIEWVKSKDVED
jgi:hypothetical protein